MALDPTSRESNVRDSLKKFFVDSIARSEGLPLTFDRTLSVPKVQGVDVGGVDKWVSVHFGQMNDDTVSEFDLDVVVCSRQDPEGFKLAQVRDKVMGWLTDGTDPNKSDQIRRIDFYRSHPTEPWEKIGGLLVYVGRESKQMEAQDGTKFKIIPVRLKWGTKA